MNLHRYSVPQKSKTRAIEYKDRLIKLGFKAIVKKVKLGDIIRWQVYTDKKR